MADEDEWKKLSTEQKVQHKSWKARSEGYKESAKNFQIWDEGSSEFNKYLGLVKKFVTDSNELVRIQGLEAVLLFVENAQVAKKTCGEVVSGIVQKCFNSKPRMKEAAIDICLMYIEIDKNESTQEELLKGFSSKQPKVATACIEAVTRALSLFGSKVIQVKPLLKEIPKLADHRDKLVREAVKAMAIEIYRWAGPAIKTPLQNINAVMLKELEEEWSKADADGKPKQTRFMRSQQDLREKMEAKSAAGGDTGAQATAAEEGPEVDPFDLMEPVEILSKLTKNFFEQIEAKKWQERKEMLEACLKLCENPRIEPGDFGDLVRALKKVISKDSNVMLVTIAAKCVAGLARGIRKKFQPFATACTDSILEKFKEKKPTVVAALQEAIDAVYLSTTLQNISESCIEALENKNPSIREQTGLFLARGLTKTKSSSLSKGLIKPIIQSLLKNIDHSASNVRDAAFQALGTLLKLVGEKMMLPFIADIDNLKVEKIKLYAEKSEIVGKGGGPKVQTTAPATAKPTAAPAKPTSTTTSKSKPSKPDQSKQKVVKGGQKPDKKKAKQPADNSEPASEPVLSDIAVEDQIAEFLSAEILAQLNNMNWKERLEGLKSVLQKLKLSDTKSIPCQAIVKTLGSGKPGWKDNNFNCMNEKFLILKNLAENATFSKTSAELCMQVLIEKIGDVKCGNSAKEAITAIAEATTFPWISETLIEAAMSHKNPKIQSESLTWLSNAITEFGMAGANVKLFISKIKIGFGATNPAVRTAAFALFSSMTLYIGPKIRMFFEGEKAALLQQIDAEIEKKKGESPPPVTRGIKSSGQNESDEEEDEKAAEVKVEDLVPRVNIADSITENLLSQLADKNWKVRRDALGEVTRILDEAKFIEPTIGELSSAMKARLGDSNKILVNTTLGILSQLSTALGSHCSKHVKVIAPGLVGVLADSKANVRQSALNTMNLWLENTKLSLWLEDEIMSSALSVPKHSFLRIELLNWLTEKLLATPKLPASSKDELEACIKHLYSCCEDRTGDVRAKAQAALPAFIYHLGMDKMVRLCGKLPQSSINTISGLLEKSKELVPARKTAPAKKAQKPPPPVEIEVDIPKAVEEPKPSKPAEKAPSKPSSKGGKRAQTTKKAPEEEDVGPALVKIPNGKEQRMKDEQKLKTLKWVFDAPRDELVSQLKSQLQPCVNSTLYTEMFHADFQHHLKALNMFTQAMESQWEVMLATMDLILRWITLRFYEKNTTVHMRCLELLKGLFSKLNESDYRLSEYEAGAFIPHLITKIGEPKENIRKDVHTIMQLITKVYPAGKVFNYLMQGLLTKNSRQKTECLDELSLLIASHGVEVCQPTPPKALKEVATHIGDRDNSVRSAALNVIVSAYNACGDLVYKYVGRLNEKNMSMLEERIKRSGKFSSEPPATAAPVSSRPESKMQKPSASKQPQVEKPKISTSDLHSSATSQSKKIDRDTIDESAFQMPQLFDTSCDDVLNEEDPEVPSRFVSRISTMRQQNSSEVVDSTLNMVITCYASGDIDICLNATHQINELLRHKEKHCLLIPRIDQVLIASSIQIRKATNRYLVDIDPEKDSNNGEGDADHTLAKVVSLYKNLLSINMTIFTQPELALSASINPLQDFLHALIIFILDKRLEYLPTGPRIISTFNLLVGEMIVTANITYILCALIRLLRTTMENPTSKVGELVNKCIWKALRENKESVNDSSKPPLQVSMILVDLNRFLVAYPTSHPKHKLQKEMSLRTAKFVIQNCCKLLGTKIYDELRDIDDVESSELMQMIRKFVKYDQQAHSLRASAIEKKENMGGNVNGDMSPGRKLSLIVKKVGNRELTKQGLQELYDFKEQHPEYDVESGFTNMSPLFLSYIKRSLITIEQERKKGTVDSSNILKANNKNLKAKDHLEHIRMLRARCGLPVDNQKNSENKALAVNSNAVNKIEEDTESDNRQLHAPVAKSIDLEKASSVSVPSVSASAVPARPASASNMDSLKRRLEKIKAASRKRN